MKTERGAARTLRRHLARCGQCTDTDTDLATTLANPYASLVQVQWAFDVLEYRGVVSNPRRALVFAGPRFASGSARLQRRSHLKRSITMKRGDYVRTLYHDGLKLTTLYGIVVRSGPKTVSVRWESGILNRIKRDQYLDRDVKLCEDTAIAMIAIAEMYRRTSSSN